jgi:hypothetical protein
MTARACPFHAALAAWLARVLVVLVLVGLGPATSEVVRDPVAVHAAGSSSPPERPRLRTWTRREQQPTHAAQLTSQRVQLRRAPKARPPPTAPPASARPAPTYLVHCALLR